MLSEYSLTQCSQSQTFTLTEIIFILFSIFSWCDCVTEYLWVDGVNAKKNRNETTTTAKKAKNNIKYSTEKQKDSLMAHKKRNLIKWVKRLCNNMLIFFLLFCSHLVSFSLSFSLHPPSTHT